MFVQGSGNYVRHRPAVNSVYAFFRLELLKGGGLPTADVLTVDRLTKPDSFVALGGDGQGHRIRRLRFLDGVMIALEEIWLDGAIRDRIAVSDLSDSLYHFYRHDLGIVIASVEDRIGVACVPEWAPEAFHLSPGAAVGYIERVSWTATKEPAEFSRTWYDAKRANYISRMGKG